MTEFEVLCVTKVINAYGETVIDKFQLDDRRFVTKSDAVEIVEQGDTLYIRWHDGTMARWQ